jgi:hypothetical protein
LASQIGQKLRNDFGKLDFRQVSFLEGIMYRKLGLIIGTLALSLQAPTISAADDDGWEIILAPYLWGITTEGKTAIGPLPPVDVDASFGDLIDAMNIGGSLHTEFRKGKWNFVIDPTYLDLEMDVPDQTVTIPNPNPPPANQDITVGGKIKVKMWFVEGWASYLVAPGWEILGGARWQSQDYDVEVNNIPKAPSFKEDWADLFGGLRWTKAFNDKWSVAVRGDYAFAGDSESGSWNAQAIFNRRFGKSMALNIGYRYYTDEYKTDSFLWDMDISGAILGYTWQFGNVSWPR